MTTVIHLARRSAGTRVQTSAHSRAPKSAPAAPATAHGVGTVDRQAAIENAFNMALYFMRQPGETAENSWAATAHQIKNPTGPPLGFFSRIPVCSLGFQRVLAQKRG